MYNLANMERCLQLLIQHYQPGHVIDIYDKDALYNETFKLGHYIRHNHQLGGIPNEILTFLDRNTDDTPAYIQLLKFEQQMTERSKDFDKFIEKGYIHNHVIDLETVTLKDLIDLYEMGYCVIKTSTSPLASVELWKYQNITHLLNFAKSIKHFPLLAMQYDKHIQLTE